jgi:hypothetical protein
MRRGTVARTQGKPVDDDQIKQAAANADFLRNNRAAGNAAIGKGISFVRHGRGISAHSVVSKQHGYAMASHPHAHVDADLAAPRIAGRNGAGGVVDDHGGKNGGGSRRAVAAPASTCCAAQSAATAGIRRTGICSWWSAMLHSSDADSPVAVSGVDEPHHAVHGRGHEVIVQQTLSLLAKKEGPTRWVLVIHGRRARCVTVAGSSRPRL